MYAALRSSTMRTMVGPLVFAAALVLTRLVRADLNPAGTPIFYLSIAVSAWLGGWTAALICATLCSGVVAGFLLASDSPVSAVAMAPLWVLSYFAIPLLFGVIDSARRRATAELRERDARLQLVGEQIPASLWSTDAELRLTSGFGAGFAVLHGDQRRTLAEHFSTSDPDFPPIAAHRKALEGISSSYEMLSRGRTFQCHVEPLRNVQGGIVGVVGVALDITERKHLEDGLKQAKDLAEAATHAKDQFLAVLSHELRTPLAPVLAAAHVLAARGDLPTEAQHDVEVIRRNVELQARLIDDLLDLTRIANGKLGLVLRPVDAHQVLRDALEVCQEGLAQKEISLHVAFDAERSHCRGDSARLQQVFWNLIKNAIKFTPAGGVLTIRTSDAPAGLMRVEVSDTGIGIEPHVLPRIFDAFEQGRASVTRKFGGLGLGLAISKALVDAHGGRLMAASEGRNRGSTFTVELPAFQSVAAPTRAPARPAPVEPATQISLRRLRLLLVEDHDDTRRMLARLLREFGHYVRTADSIAAARAAIEEDPAIDAVLSDLDLPDGTGHDLMRHVASRRPGLKGIALSGHGMEGDLRRSAEAGFSRHLVKPVDLSALQKALEEVGDVAVSEERVAEHVH